MVRQGCWACQSQASGRVFIKQNPVCWSSIGRISIAMWWIFVLQYSPRFVARIRTYIMKNISSIEPLHYSHTGLAEPRPNESPVVLIHGLLGMRRNLGALASIDDGTPLYKNSAELGLTPILPAEHAHGLNWQSLHNPVSLEKRILRRILIQEHCINLKITNNFDVI